MIALWIIVHFLFIKKCVRLAQNVRPLCYASDMKQNEIIASKVGATFRHMQRTYTYSHTSEGIHYWQSESVNGAHYIRQTQA